LEKTSKIIKSNHLPNIRNRLLILLCSKQWEKFNSGITNLVSFALYQPICWHDFYFSLVYNKFEIKLEWLCCCKIFLKQSFRNAIKIWRSISTENL